MKKVFLGMITVLLALLVTASAVTPAFAQSESAPQRITEDVTRPSVKALGIHAPKITLVGQEITVTAFERGTQKTVSGAGVWAIPWDRSQTLQDEINTLQSNEAFDTETYDYEVLCGRYGEFLGKTAGHGELNHTFNQSGQYLLVAVKNQYYPGFAKLTVREIPKALGSRAPKVAQVDTFVTMTVFERGTQEPVAGAGIWAFSRENAVSIKTQIDVSRETMQDSAQDHDFETLLNNFGPFLGRTNDDGQLTHKFEEAGDHILVTWKRGYYPGFTSILIKPEVKSLMLRASQVAFVGKPVTMTVYERINWPVFEAAPNPIEDAHIWAVPRNEVEALRERIAGVDSDDISAIDYESVLDKYLHLGMTDGNGQLTYTFREAANYVLVTWKSGYRPGFAPLTVRTLPQMLVIKAPPMARVDQDIDITIYERFTQQPIVGADVWAVSWDQTETLSELSADIRATGEVGLTQADAESIMNSLGAIWLGKSGNNGQLTCSFDHAGRYILVAFENGYWPGFGWITIKDIQPVEPMGNGKLRPQIRPQVLQD